ncbi:hypothetical protein LLG95_02995 [bacterium]|nr:hypothetical protein [bacterium]
MENKIHAILSELERTKENLLSLSDDIWLSIDHNNSKALDAGVEFKRKYNEKMMEFDRVATDLSTLIQKFTSVSLERPVENEIHARNDEANQRIIRELDKETPHSLSEDYRYKRPYGFVIQGKAYKDQVTWKRVYELVCQHLLVKNRRLMEQLPNNPDFESSRGNRSFAQDPGQLRSSMKITEKLYAEVNLSANSLRDNIRRLLKTFGILETEVIVYLREDRDALD